MAAVSTTTLTLTGLTGVNPDNNSPFTAPPAPVVVTYSPPAPGTTTAVGGFVSFVVSVPGLALPTSQPVVTISSQNAARPTAPVNSQPTPGASTTNPEKIGPDETGTPVSDPGPQIIVKKETNGGVVAGVAIGCLLAGALIGFFIALFLYRKRQRQQQGGENGTYIVSSVGEPKAHHPAPPPAPAKDSGLQLEKFLLDSVPDNEIARELHALGSLIQQHVENNYHLHPIRADTRQLALALKQLGLEEDGQHSGLGGGSSLSAETVAALAIEPQTRHIALQHVISHVVFSSIDAGSRSRLSMLPAPVAAFLQSVAPPEGGRVNEEASAIALNQWRVLSSFLLHPARSQRTPLPPSDNAVAGQAAGLANALNTFLGYFVSGDSGQQNAHLQAVIAETTKLGYVLLSQPSEWRFVHNDGGASRNGVAVVCAGLIKVTGKDGTMYAAPVQVVAPVVVQV